MKLISLVLFLKIGILSFGNAKETDNILPQIIHENEEVTVYAIKDSIHIDSDSLFFHVDVFRQDMSYIKGYVPIIDGKAKFTVPKDAALLMGYFYSMNDRSATTYIRRVHNKDGKIARNAYQNAYTSYVNKENLQKELSNYSDNMMAYANYAYYLAEGYSLGRVSDTLFKKEVKEALRKVQKNADNKKADDLAALSMLYAHNQQFDKSKELLYRLLSDYPNSNFLNRAFSIYNYSYSLHNDKNDDFFMESFRQTVGKYHPRSPLGRGDMHGEYSNNKWIIKGYYKDEDIIANNNYNFKYMDSTSEYWISANIGAYLNQKDYVSAKKWATFLLQEAKKGKWLHDAPLYKKERKHLFGKDINTSVAFSYYWLSYVETKFKEFESALSHVDSALYFSKARKNEKFLVYFYRTQLERKVFLQKQLNQDDEALKTYETLYRETEEESVLDSMKVLFNETEQEKNFESYVQDLKERVENKTKEPKQLASNFSMKDMNNNEINLSDLKGQVVVMNFWANYCSPCIAEIPLLNEFWRETKMQDITFLAATTNTPNEVTRFAEQQKEMFGFSVLPNAKELSKSYDIGSLPTTVIINKKGEIVHQEFGFSGNIDKLKQVVLEELKK
ncbi:TlpA disulfide reductase family protein [Bernardetia sp. ABR2-2B]|uniref:peroxiredoxin family protein n=1 Tax=Bernardetia sp. ABR2-2B TaxID=3127472 RepID=UPI0030D03064